MMFDETMIEKTLGFWVNRAAFLMRADLVRRFREAGHDITAEEFAILNRVHLDQAPTLKEVAEKTTKDKTTMTRFVDKLVKKGLLRRRPDPEDRRCVRVHLTDRGEVIRHDLLPIAMELLKESVGGIPDDEVAITMKVLRGISENLGHV